MYTAGTAAPSRVVMSSPHDTASQPPSVVSQMQYIEQNAKILDIPTKKTILSLVMMEVGKTVSTNGTTVPVVMENKKTKEPTIMLSNIPNPIVISHIYNIVRNRRSYLSEPAKHSSKSYK